jgi:hypothetical protein
LNRRFQFLGISETSSARTAEHLLDRLLVDDPAQARHARVLTRDHDGHVVVQDLDGEVLALLTEHLAALLLEDLARPVVGVDHVVAALELDVLDDRGLEVLEQVLFDRLRK